MTPLASREPARLTAMPFDVARIREDFPILRRQIGSRPIVYLDSAATSLKPQPVIDAILGYYTQYTANIKRGVHPLADEATERYEEARHAVAGFINADSRDIVFVRNTTEAINLVAGGLAIDTPVLYGLGEHHSNLIPWQRRAGSEAVPVTSQGAVDCEYLQRRLARGDARLLAIAHVSNALGAVNPVEEIVAFAHRHGCRVLIDASQSIPHRPIDVVALGCDYLCFSGHKMCGPSGIGVLYATQECFQAMPPQVFGGGMVSEVHEDGFELGEIPWRFEAGTPFIEGVIGLGAACSYLSSIGLAQIHAHENVLLSRGLAGLAENARVRVHGPLDAAERGSSLSFTVNDMDPHGVARLLATRFNIFVRSGFHCAQPAHEALQIRPTVRASVYLYNDPAEIDQLVEALSSISTYCAN